MSKYISFVATVVALCVCADVAANIAPDPEIHSLIQHGQDVEVTISTQGSGLETHPMDSPMELVRHRNDTQVTVLEPHLFTADEVAEIELYCHTYEDIDYCQINPDECNDCDDDGVLECPQTCSQLSYVSFVDECVLPGNVGYQLLIYSAAMGEDWENTEPFDLGREEILVTDTGDTCLPPMGSLCSVAIVNGQGSGGALTALMLSLGLGLLVTSRKKRGG